MTGPSWEGAHTTDRRTLLSVALADSPSYGKIPCHLRWQARCPANYQRPDRGKLSIQIDRTTRENELVISPHIVFTRYPKIGYSAYSCVTSAHQLDMYGPQRPKFKI